MFRLRIPASVLLLLALGTAAASAGEPPRVGPAPPPLPNWKNLWKRHRPVAMEAFWIPAPPPPAPTPIPAPAPSDASGFVPGEVPPPPVPPTLTAVVVEQILIPALGDGVPRVRSESALGLGRIGRHTALLEETLRRRAEDPEETEDVRGSALIALAGIGSRELSLWILDVFADAKEPASIRCHAAVALGLMRCRETVPALIAALAEEDAPPDARGGALAALGLAGGGEAAAALHGYLVDAGASPLERAVAAASLASMESTEFFLAAEEGRTRLDVVEAMEKALADRSSPAALRRVAALALGEIGRRGTSVEALLQASREDPDAGTAGFALFSLGRLLGEGEAGTEAAGAIAEALGGEGGGSVTAFGALAASVSGDRRFASALHGIFNSHVRPGVRAASALALGRLGWSPAIEDLGREVEMPRDGGDARGFACMAVGLIGTPQGLRYLESILESVRVPYLLWWAARGLAFRGEEGDRLRIESILREKSAVSRRAGAMALSLLGGEQALRDLLDALENEKEKDTKALYIHLASVMACPGGLRPLDRLARLLPGEAAAGMPAFQSVLKRKR